MRFPRVALQEIAQIVGGGRLKLSGNDFLDEGFPAYGAGGLNGRLAVAEFDRSAVILSAIGARCGKCFIAEGQWTSLANTQLIFPDEKRVDVRFLWYQLNDEARWPRAGVAQPFIKPSDVKSHLVVLPPLEEQKRIAAILDQADALRRLRARALTRLNALGQAIFHEMFGDRSETVVRPLHGVAELINGDRSSNYPSGDEIKSEGIPFLSTKNIKNGQLDLGSCQYITPEKFASLSRGKLKRNDIVITLRGTLGQAAIFDCEYETGFINAQMMIIRPKHGLLISTEK